MSTDQHTDALIAQAHEKLSKCEDEAKKTKQFINQLLVYAGREPMYPDDAPASRVVMTLNGDEYVGKPQTTACRLILERRKTTGLGPATLDELHRDLVAGGYLFETENESNAKRGLYQSLTKNTNIFFRLSHKKYGLIAWYPGVKEKGSDESEKEVEGKANPSIVETDGFAVVYRAGHSGSGHCSSKTVLVTAYSAEDAAFQALIGPKNQAAVHAPYEWVCLLLVTPYELGMKYDLDSRRPCQLFVT